MSDLAYSVPLNTSDSLRVQENTGRVKSRLEATQRKYFKELYDLSRFLTTQEALAYLATVEEIPDIHTGKTMSKDRDV